MKLLVKFFWKIKSLHDKGTITLLQSLTNRKSMNLFNISKFHFACSDSFCFIASQTITKQALICFQSLPTHSKFLMAICVGFDNRVPAWVLQVTVNSSASQSKNAVCAFWITHRVLSFDLDNYRRNQQTINALP